MYHTMLIFLYLFDPDFLLKNFLSLTTFIPIIINLEVVKSDSKDPFISESDPIRFLKKNQIDLNPTRNPVLKCSRLDPT
jgi:hypothetical protein